MIPPTKGEMHTNTYLCVPAAELVQSRPYRQMRERGGERHRLQDAE